jgi:hypothetical protein
MNNQKQEHSLMTVLAGIWKHTPLGIVIDALRKPSAARRARQEHKQISPPGSRMPAARGLRVP